MATGARELVAAALAIDIAHVVIGTLQMLTTTAAPAVTTTVVVDVLERDPGLLTVIDTIDLAAGPGVTKTTSPETAVHDVTVENGARVQRANRQPHNPRRMSETGGLSSFSSLLPD